jgi:hypothetical protein
MTLRREGVRHIVADGAVYSWRLRRHSTYLQDMVRIPCTFAVEHADTSGLALFVTSNRPHLSN